MMHGRILLLAAIAATFACPCAARDEPQPATYSRAEIDAKLNELKAALSADIDAKLGALKFVSVDTDKKLDALKSFVSVDTDAKVDALKRSLLGGSYSKAEMDTKLASLTSDTDKKLDGLGQREATDIKVIEAKIPTAPWYANALLAAVCSLLVSLWVSNKSADRSEAQKDAERRVDASEQIVDHWVADTERVANAEHLLKSPNELQAASNKNVIIGLGNWYERVAERWLDGRVDTSILEAHNLKQIMSEFWAKLEDGKNQTPRVDFGPQQAEWPHLEKLVAPKTP
jgi:hypothetical protein